MDNFELHENFLLGIVVARDGYGLATLFCKVCKDKSLLAEDQEEYRENEEIPFTDIYKASMGHIHTREHLINLRDSLPR